jgi:hypothetical protein
MEYQKLELKQLNNNKQDHRPKYLPLANASQPTSTASSPLLIEEYHPPLAAGDTKNESIQTLISVSLVEMMDDKREPRHD